MFHVEQKKIETCPICGGKISKQLLVCKDYTVSQADFNVMLCGSCEFAITSPRPHEQDLGRYYESDEYISHSNTKKGLISRLYQAVRKRALRGKLGLLNSLVGKTGSMLDVGCGTGEFLGTCKEAGWQTMGIEPSEMARKQGRENFGLDVREEAAIDSLPEKSFDAITMWHVLEHVPDLPARVKRLKLLLKDDGVLIVAVPNRASHDAEHYGKFWAAYDVPRHLWHYRAKDMRALMSNHGFEVKAVLPMKFDSYYVSMLSEKYKTGRIRYLAAFWRGWVSNRKAGTEGWSSLTYVIRHKN